MESLPEEVPKETEKEPIMVEVVSDSNPKVISYASKKSVAQRMMDIALLTSNSNQLRYIFMYGKDSQTFPLAVTLIVVSLALQVAVGLFLIFKAKKPASAKGQTNNYVVAGVFLITIVNVLASAFTIENGGTPTSPIAALAARSMNLSELE